MQRFWRNIGVLAALILANTPVIAHEPQTAVPALSAGEQAGSTVTIQTFQFKPPKLDVKAGTKVTWINEDDIRHTVTSGSPEKKDARFDAPLAGKGTSFSFTFSQPGTYSYFCDRHEHMRGEVQVR
ncbi:MAG TPA: plastocyanin/azurin family copper-binding protein [Candidatus Binatia bacterium]|nr:plastocyanin/azurin family copper-binding protein [Candidatus Binatia bacterium]